MVDITPFLSGLSPVPGKAVVAGFDGGRLSSEGGLLALREIERRLGVADRLAGCLRDPPTPTDLLEVGVRQSRSLLPRHRPPRRGRQGLSRGADYLPRDITAAFRSFRTAYPMPP